MHDGRRTTGNSRQKTQQAYSISSIASVLCLLSSDIRQLSSVFCPLMPKILVIPGSLRAQSYNGRLAALATKELTLADADVTRISLLDYPLPIYDADLAEKSGPPQNALRLKQMMSAHQGVFIASPEYNASITPLVKNTIDWISVVREAGKPALAAFAIRVFALGG